MLVRLAVLLQLVQHSLCVTSFFSPDDLKYTFGVDRLAGVPQHRLLYPLLEQQDPSSANSSAPVLRLRLGDGEELVLPLHSVTGQLLAHRLTVVDRVRGDGGGRLESSEHPLSLVQDCHFHHHSEHAQAAISMCDEGELKGTILRNGAMYVLHPIPARHIGRVRRSADGQALHVLYKRTALVDKREEFCGIENTITSEELVENEAGVHEDVFVVGQRLTQEGDLVVELAVFVDEQLWRHFSAKYGALAWQKLQQYALTMLSNIQIMYRQPTAVPAITFRVVRYEVFQTQPSAIAAYLHENGHAQRYLDKFCRYQRSLGVRDWDHALMLTGFDIHRGYGANSISGIARLDGMCDPWNTCTLAEGLDFTSAFIGTHELGHSVGMRHDEPYCASTYIMSSSLGPGKVTWSACSLRDYQTFVQRMDGRRKNCLRTSLLREKLPLTDSLKPGQIYDAHEQCRLMHGPSYIQVTPRQDHYDGICHMIWCGQGAYGRIVTSHPALEGTFCGPNKWCSLGRCVPWTGFGAPLAPRPPVQGPAPVPTTTTAAPSRVDGQWSGWSAFECAHCSCADVVGSIGVTISQRSCNSPAPQNGGAECAGPGQRAAVCARKCQNENQSVNQYISTKCAEHKRLRNDPELTGTGAQLSRFPQRACKVFCDVQNGFGSQRNYRFYGDNLPDGAPCGWDRYCLNGECTELSCEDSLLSVTRDDSAGACPASHERCPLSIAAAHSAQQQQTAEPQGQWGLWSLWSACTASCGDTGVQIRSRTCSIVNRCEGEPTESQECNRHACPTVAPSEPQWTEWTPWNQCSVSCGKGSQARYRRCSTAQNTIAFSCPGQTMELRNCEELPCPGKTPTGGRWSEWSAWSACSSTCGPGNSVRTRSCAQSPCDGPSQQRLACNLRECGAWNPWASCQNSAPPNFRAVQGAWSECSRLCGKGVNSRSRTCPAGVACSGPTTEQQFCNEQPCVGPQADESVQWSGWSAWGPCSVSCGNGVRRRTRHCQRGNCPGNYFESAICNEGPCAVSDASWGGWGYWSACSETCGNGVRRRVRKCYGSGTCPGNEFERESCIMGQTCP